MNRWIVKASSDGNAETQGWTSRPMQLAEAADLAETLVNASPLFVNVIIEFDYSREN